MDTIIKSAKHLALILGIGERAVTTRAGKVKLKEYALKIKLQRGLMSIDDYERSLSKEQDKQLAGYSCDINDDEGKRVITFYKNV